MGKKQFLKLMDIVIRHHKRLNDLYDKASNLFGNCDKLITVTNIDKIVDCIAEIVGDKNDYLSWYIYENNYGQGDNRVFDENGDRLPSETLEDLWNLIKDKENAN